MDTKNSEIRMAQDPSNINNTSHVIVEKKPIQTKQISKIGKKVKSQKKLSKKYKGLKWRKTIKKIVKEYPDSSIPLNDLRNIVIDTQISRIRKDLIQIFNDKIKKPNKIYALVGHDVKRLQCFLPPDEAIMLNKLEINNADKNRKLPQEEYSI